MHFKRFKIFLLVIDISSKRLKGGRCLKFLNSFIDMVLHLTGIYFKNIVILFISQNICCGYTNEPSKWDGSFEHSKYV